MSTLVFQNYSEIISWAFLNVVEKMKTLSFIIPHLDMVKDKDHKIVK